MLKSLVSAAKGLNPVAIISSLVSTGADIYKNKQQARATRESAAAKLSLAKLNSEANIQLTQAEWESLKVKQGNGSWLDEWVTVILTVPVPTIFVAAIVSVYTGNSTAIDAVTAGVAAIKSLVPNYDYLIGAVVLAAIGIKAKRGISG